MSTRSSRQSVEAVKEGWLNKKGRINTAWKKRYMVLTENATLYYFNSVDDATLVSNANGSVYLKDAEIYNAEEEMKTKFCLALRTPKRTYYIQADSVQSMEDWQKELQAQHDRSEASLEEKGDSDHATLFTKPDKEGYAMKQGYFIKSWRRRWFVLKNSYLYYFKSPAETTSVTQASGAIPLADSTIAEYKDQPNAIKIITGKRVYPISFSSAQELGDWRVALGQSHGQSDGSVHPQPPTKLSARSPLLWGNQMEGFLVKQGGYITNWKKRWCVLNENILYYFINDEADEPRGWVDLAECIEVKQGGPDKHEKWCLAIVLPKRTFYFQAASEDEFAAWYKVVRSAIAKYKDSVPITSGEALMISRDRLLGALTNRSKPQAGGSGDADKGSAGTRASKGKRKDSKKSSRSFSSVSDS